MRLRNDPSALESMPLRLMIVAIVVSLSVVPASGALGALRNGDFIRRCEAQLDTIVSTSEVLAIEGPGSVRTISFDFNSDGSLRFEELVIGDSRDGANVSAVVLHLSNQGTIVRSAQNPVVSLSAADNTRLVISSPSFMLQLSCDMGDAYPQVVVELI